MANQEKLEKCVLCDYQAGVLPHFKTYGREPLQSFVVAQTDNFQVKPDVLPAEPVEGLHFLMHPKRHTFNYADLHRDANEVGGLFYQMEHRFGPLVIFEHGGVKQGNKNQSVYHAHAHLYGGLVGFDVIAYMEHMLSGGLGYDEIYPYQIIPARDYAFLVNLKQRYNGHPYLYIEQGPWALFAEDDSERMKSQIAQRSMYRHFSGDVLGRMLNWKNIPDCEVSTRESVRRLATLVDNCNAGRYHM